MVALFLEMNGYTMYDFDLELTDTEIIILRHQLDVMVRKQKRPIRRSWPHN